MNVDRAVRGAASGALATVPMTVFMQLAHRILPPAEQYALPPRLITENAARLGRLRLPRSERGRIALTLLAHVAYGAGAGAVYALRPADALPERAPGAAADGALFGLVVWDVSYLGLLPSMRLLRAAPRHPWRRNALMLAAHVVWGGFLGAVVRRLEKGRRGPDERP